jgi:hypothetical protein
MYQELLNKLERLDPTIYEYYISGMIGRGSLTAQLCFTGVQRAWLQWTLQKAIEKHGWQINLWMNYDGLHYCCIHQKLEQFHCTSRIAEESGKDFVEAILKAYLKALDGD